jgi:hypothetical protein
MYIVIGLSGLSDSSHNSCATIEADTVSSIGPLRHIILSYPWSANPERGLLDGSMYLKQLGKYVVLQSSQRISRQLLMHWGSYMFSSRQTVN